MPVPVMLKQSVWERYGDALIVHCDARETIELDDPQGQAELLLSLLAEEPHDTPGLRGKLVERGVTATVGEIEAALDALNSVGLIEKAGSQDLGGAIAGDERNSCNLGFFGMFSSAEMSPVDFQERLSRAHVLQLGVGGLGSSTMQSLAGLGVGRLTLLDSDVVELRNFAQQFLYRRSDIGRPKVDRAAEWVHQFNPDIDVTAVKRRINGPQDVASLMADVDLVVSCVDKPRGFIDLWVNEACMRAGVPWVRGGTVGSLLLYFSVDPGRSPCYADRDRDRVEALASAEQETAAARLNARLYSSLNSAIGPAVALTGSLMAFEALRYLTGFRSPSAAGVTVLVDLRSGCEQRRELWRADEDCALCRDLTRRRSGAPRPLRHGSAA